MKFREILVTSLVLLSPMQGYEIGPRSLSETDILLIRHGETDWNLERKIQGSEDIPLNATGLAQAEKLSEKLWEHHQDISRTLYSSDLQRAAETAKKTAEIFFSKESSIVPIVTHRDLRECTFGVLEGVVVSTEHEQLQREYREQLKTLYPVRAQRWNHPLFPAEGVESFDQLVTRAKSALSQIAQAHPGEKVAVFTHGRLINTLILAVEEAENDERPPLPNCAVVHFRYSSENPDRPLRFIKVENLFE
jgi:2,3-bisphosphoglycerate-dependent phosphoglycerate mutase